MYKSGNTPSQYDRHDLLQKVGESNGFVDLKQVVCCPYCYRMFANGIKPEVLRGVWKGEE